MSIFPAITTKSVTGVGLYRRAWLRLQQNLWARWAGWFLAILLMLLFAAGPLLSPYAPDHADWDHILVGPGLVARHYLGTDVVGRDLFARIMQGGRISLMVGLAGALVSLVIGVCYGAIAGFVGGRLDAVMMRLVDLLYALPFMFFVILLMVFFGRSFLLIFVAIGAINWLDMARIVRGQTMSLRHLGFIEAARVYGQSGFGILVHHIIPNLLGIVLVYATLTIPQVMMIEAFLSFLGLGVQEPMTSWGTLIKEGADLMEVAPYLLIFPGACFAMTVLCFNILGDGLRDALDPKER
jgi:oligopeptide transport system permease protein